MPKLYNRLVRAMLHLYPFPRGQGRIVDRFFNGLAFEDERLTVRTKDGFLITVIPNDLIGRQLYLTGQFDRTIVEILLHFSREGDCIADIGANIGYITCSMLHHVAGVKMISVEPIPYIFDLLEKNVARFSTRDARCIRAAISDRDGSGHMAVRNDNIGASRVVQAPSAPSENVIEIPLITGSSLVEQAGTDRIDLVKIDVEGHEANVIGTLAKVFEKHRPRAVLFEHFDDLTDPSSVIRQVFDQLDYEIAGVQKRLTRWDLVPIDELKRRGLAANDYVATPRPK